MILKPAEEASASVLAVFQALLDAGLPDGVAQIVFGDPDEISTHLLASPIIRKLSFTGSTSVGQHLLGLASKSVKRSTLELGRHAPVLIFDDCDFERMIATQHVSKIKNAGQVCVSPIRFFVQDGIYDRFLNEFGQLLRNTRVGNGLFPSSEMGPLAHARRPQALKTLVDDALKHGGGLVTGGKKIEGPGYFWEPTLISEVPRLARIMNEEPFGPVAIANSFGTFDDAIEMANDSPFGLAGYVFSQNNRTTRLAADALDVGMVGVNTTKIAHVDSPFGGIKQSGFGAEDGHEGLMACMVNKAVHEEI